MTCGENALSVADLCVRDAVRSRAVIEGVCFEVARGEFVSLVGPSGSGKSTTVLSVLGLLRPPLEPVSGSGQLAGAPVEFSDPSSVAGFRGTRAAMIFQDPFASLNPVLRCGTQVEEPLRIHTDLDRGRRRERVLELFSEVGFEDPGRVCESLPSELSGGQVQRVMIAMAVALEPVLLLADEPTTALDPSTERVVVGLLDRLRRKHGMAVMLITHDAQLAESVSDRILSMREGRLMSREAPDRGRYSAVGSAARFRAAPGRAFGSERIMSVRAVSKTFRRQSSFGGDDRQIRALREISLDIHRGEIVGVFGPSGSGKTTLGRCLAGLEGADAGTILLEDAAISAPRRIGRTSPVQLIYQNPYASLNPVMAVGDAIEEGLRSRRVPHRQRRGRALRLLTLVGLPKEFYSRLPRELSGGERQRIVIARALAVEPKILVADEPTASLDERTGTRILGLLARLSRELGLSVLLISHDLEAVARVAVRVVKLEDGRLREEG